MVTIARLLTDPITKAAFKNSAIVSKAVVNFLNSSGLNFYSYI